jgi:hypothetical protein
MDFNLEKASPRVNIKRTNVRFLLTLVLKAVSVGPLVMDRQIQRRTLWRQLKAKINHE